MLALKVAEIENLRAALGDRRSSSSTTSPPSSIPQKNHYLLDYLGRLPGQAFLTTTDPRLLEPAAGPETAVYTVGGGRFADELAQSRRSVSDADAGWFRLAVGGRSAINKEL